MSISYTWSFPKFDVATSEDGLSNVVKVIFYILTATDDASGASVTREGAFGIPDADPSIFIPLENLTKQWAIERSLDYMNSCVPDFEGIKSDMAEQLSQVISPPVQEYVPPFA